MVSTSPVRTAVTIAVAIFACGNSRAFAQPMSLPKDYVIVPGGAAHSSCVHELPDETNLNIESDGRLALIDARSNRREIPRCQREFIRGSSMPRSLSTSGGPAGRVVPTVEGWLESSDSELVGRNWTKIRGQWTVPNEPPTKSDQVVFLFNAITSSDRCSIDQPVLQWGSNGSGSGRFWTIANWFVDVCNGTTTHSPFKRVNPGQVIYGEVYTSGCNSSWCGQMHVAYSVNGGSKVHWAAGPSTRDKRLAHRAVLEAYRIGSCSQLPASPAAFFDVHAYRSTTDPNALFETAGWGSIIFATGTPNCNWAIDAISDNQVVLKWTN
jgi:hypothetical protein